MHLLRALLPRASISVEIEKPGRDGLAELAAEADVVFYSRVWAEVRPRRPSRLCTTSCNSEMARFTRYDQVLSSRGLIADFRLLPLSHRVEDTLPPRRV
jgi:hypothetical protein